MGVIAELAFIVVVVLSAIADSCLGMSLRCTEKYTAIRRVTLDKIVLVLKMIRFWLEEASS